MMDDGSNQTIGKKKHAVFNATCMERDQDWRYCWVHVHAYTKGCDEDERRRETCGGVVAGWMGGYGDVVVGT